MRMPPSFLSRWLYFYTCILGLCLLSGCNFKDEKNTPTQPTVTLDPNQAIKFTEVKAKVFSASCSCHSPAGGNLGGINLDTFALVKNSLAAIKRTSLDSTRMPPGSPLSSNAAAVLRTWIEQGAPE